MPFALNSPARHRARTLRWLVLLAGFALLTPALRAQVVFQREIGMSSNHTPLLRVSNAPFDLSDPLYDSTTTHRPWVVSSQNYYRIDPENGVATDPDTLPFQVKLTTDAHISFAGRNTSTAIAFVLGFRKTLYVVNISGPTPVVVGPVDGVPVPLAQVHSMAAADRTHLTMIGDGWFQSINIDTGELTPIFSLDGGTGQRQFSSDDSAGENRGTRYHTYGPNGLLYLLDYGNDRMQILDPGNAFAYVSEFSLQSGVTTANMSFAIGINGNIYLGDGAGGGSAYSATGDFLGAFTPSIVPTPPSSAGAPLIDTDAAGNVYVYDATGKVQYRDMSAVPEPSTAALIVVAGAALLARSRRHRSRVTAQAIFANGDYTAR